MNDMWKSLPWDNIRRVASHAGLDPILVAAIVATESGGQTYATRYEAHWKYLVDVDAHAKRLGITVMTETMHQATSWGLMQIMGGTAREMGFRDHMPKLCEVEIGLLWGCLYLTRLSNRYKNLDDVIVSYNSGSPRKGDDGRYLNQQYLDTVKKIYTELI